MPVKYEITNNRNIIKPGNRFFTMRTKRSTRKKRDFLVKAINNAIDKTANQQAKNKGKNKKE
jgi:hypothetical protein